MMSQCQTLEEFIGDILVPSENIVEMKDGKKKVKEKVFSQVIY